MARHAGALKRAHRRERAQLLAHLLEPRGAAVRGLAVAVDGRVHRHENGAASGRLGVPQHRGCVRTVERTVRGARWVHLEKERRAGRRVAHLADWRASKVRAYERRAARGGGTRDRDLAIRMCGARGRKRRDNHGAVHRAAEDGCRRAHRLAGAKHPRPQRPQRPRAHVGADRLLVFRAITNVESQTLRHELLRPRLDRREARQPRHLLPAQACGAVYRISSTALRQLLTDGRVGAGEHAADGERRETLGHVGTMQRVERGTRVSTSVLQQQRATAR
eukprot:4655419-Prymnesium_polylepis.1